MFDVDTKKAGTRVIGFEDTREARGPIVLHPGQEGQVLLQPHTLFRVDRVYFETEGLTIQRVDVGRQPQGIDGVPSSYYKEREIEDGMKGRAIRFMTCEVGNTIVFYLKNNNEFAVTVRGCVEGGYA